jgi:N-acetylglucosamine-6-sulfatase
MRRIGSIAGAIALGCGGLAALSGGSSGAAAHTPSAPNIVVVMTDDETVEQMRVMSQTQALIADQGVTFANEFDNFSLCCPSRSTFLTGLYAHNHKVLSNAPPLGGFDRFERRDSSNDLPLWLQAAGYTTGEVGKYLNHYGVKDPTLVPPGWTEWDALSGLIGYYDYKLNENGTLVSYGEDPADYVDDVITSKAVDFIDRRAPETAPFFLYVAYRSPHGGGPYLEGDRCDTGPEPAPRHYGEEEAQPLPMPPSFNEADISDKPAGIAGLPKLDDAQIAALTERYRCELESILGVDDGVKAIMDQLQASGELDNTYVIYTSDNGYLHGEHRIAHGKVVPYEPSIRVPLLMRGPGIPAGRTVRDLTINADLAPTIASLANTVPGRVEDGESLMPLIRHPAHRLGRELEIESRYFKGIRTRRYLYVEYTSGEKELYDLVADPDELQNVANTEPYATAQAALAADLPRLRRCAGERCRRAPAVHLEVHFRQRADSHGRPCALAPVNARVSGPEGDRLTAVRFSLNGTDAGRADTAPFRVTLPDESILPDAHNQVRGVADLVDGRRVNLVASFPPLCA